MLIRSRRRSFGLHCEDSAERFKLNRPNAHEKMSQPIKMRSIHSSPAHKPSRFHERCFDPWIPAGRASHHTVKRRKGDQRPETYPLCLVCDRDDNSDSSASFECLIEKFHRSVHRLEELDRESCHKRENHRAKVLQDLWRMDEEGYRPPRPQTANSNLASVRTDEPSKTDKHTKTVASSASAKSPKRQARPKTAKPHGSRQKNNDSSWQEILSTNTNVSKQTKSTNREKQTNDVSPRNDIADLDLVPDKDWSAQSSMEAKVADQKPHRSKVKQGVDDIQVDIEFNSKKSQDRNKNLDKAKQLTRQKTMKEEKRLKNNYKRGDSESSQEARDIMKEFVDMSFDRAKESGDHQNSLDEKEGSPKRELEECLQKINVEISGKILQTKNGIDDDDQATNVSISLSDEKGSTLKSEQGRHMTNHLSTYLAKDKEDKVHKQHRLRSQQRSDEDVFLDILIDELKMENKELKFALVAREEKLMDAATKIREIVEENVLCTGRLEKSIRRNEQLEEDLRQRQQSYDESMFQMTARIRSLEDKMSQMEMTRPMLKTEDLEDTVNNLKKRLTESESMNENLKNYIEHLKKSYHSVFGPGNTSNSSPSSLSINP